MKIPTKVNNDTEGKVSGAGSEITALAESLQAYACATRQHFGEDLADVSQITKKTISDADCDRTLEACMKGLDENWFRSVILTANLIFSEVPGAATGKNFKFYRGGSLVDAIYSNWRKFKSGSGITGDDKWNPADIWMIKKGFKFNKDHSTLKDLNSYLYDEFENNNIIGISLKKVPIGNKVNSKIYNKGNRDTATFKSFRTGSDMTDSKDIYIEFISDKKEGELQLRTFSSRPEPSSWQGEIKGKTSAGGKIGGGLVIKAAIESGIPLSKLITPQQFKSEITKPKKETFEKFSRMFKQLSGSKDTILQLVEQAQNKQKTDKTWWLTKFIGVNYCYTIMKNKKENEVIKWLYQYASSQTKNSCIFIKYSA